MHEAALSQAALPAPARILGLTLRPFSLGHELWLVREQNALALHSTADASPVKLIQDLPQAVLFCCQTFAEIQAMNKDRFIGIKLRLWNHRLRRRNLAQELSAFLEYRTRGTLAFPDEPPDSTQRGRTLGAPLLLSLYEFMAAKVGEIAAWDYPYGLAQMRYAAHLEGEGRLKIKNRYEVEADDAFSEWEKANPESTLFVEGMRHA